MSETKTYRKGAITYLIITALTTLVCTSACLYLSAIILIEYATPHENVELNTIFFFSMFYGSTYLVIKFLCKKVFTELDWDKTIGEFIYQN